MNPLFVLEGLGMRYGQVPVLQDLNVSVAAGEFLAIAGPNGAGKSTLLSILAGLLEPSEGRCRLLGREAHLWPRREFARRVAAVLQLEPTALPFTVADVVYMGRTPHVDRLYETAADHQAVRNAMRSTGVEGLREREFRTLSGGEKQRVMLASALAQGPEILLLDEPANHLDLHYQIALYRHLRELSRQGLFVAAVTHDLNLAAAYASRFLVLKEGRVAADGAPQQVLNAALVLDVFDVHAEVQHTAAGKPWMIYGE